MPSQLFEHWLEVPEVLKEFARHCETGETLPEEMLSSILEASTFDMGFQTTEYLASAFVDLYLHLEETPVDIMERQDQILHQLNIPSTIGMRPPYHILRMFFQAAAMLAAITVTCGPR